MGCMQSSQRHGGEEYIETLTLKRQVSKKPGGSNLQISISVIADPLSSDDDTSSSLTYKLHKSSSVKRHHSFRTLSYAEGRKFTKFPNMVGYKMCVSCNEPKKDVLKTVAPDIEKEMCRKCSVHHRKESRKRKHVLAEKKHDPPKREPAKGLILPSHELASSFDGTMKKMDMAAFASLLALVNSEAGLSPGEHTVDYAERCAKKRKHAQEKSQLPSTKRRRLILKQDRAVTQVAQESLEGVSYQSGIGHSEAVDIDKLPDAVPRGTFKPVTIPSGNPTYIIMDLETTNLIRGAQMPHITQVAAVELRSGAIFNHYVCPKVPIAESAQRVTGITMVGENDMLAYGKSVKPFSWKTALAEFLTWLQKYSNVFLVAHNGRRFDFPVLMAACSSVGSLEPFMCSVLGMIDSLNVLKKLYPDRSSYRQEDIARDELHVEYKAHDAEEDVKCLSKLISVAVVTDNNLLISNSFLPKAKYHAMLFNKERSKNMPSLTMLVAKGVMKTATAENVAGSGLGLNHLRAIFKRNGEDGLMNTFTVKNSEGQPRVTNTKRTLETVIPKLVQFFENE